jgi:tetratricopeptide (TPR) repeat protein
VLEGSLRRRGEHVRIVAQLADAGSGHHHWADRYDCDLNSVFEVHDDVARTIATVLSAHLSRAEVERALLKQPASWQAYDYFLQAAHVYNSEARDGTREAHALAARAVELDPQFARAYVIIASSLVRAWVNRLVGEDSNEMALDQAHDFAAKAVQLEPRLPQARAMLGYVLSRKGEHDAALAEFSRAVERNPKSAWRVVITTLRWVIRIWGCLAVVARLPRVDRPRRTGRGAQTPLLEAGDLRDPPKHRSSCPTVDEDLAAATVMDGSALPAIDALPSCNAFRNGTPAQRAIPVAISSIGTKRKCSDPSL